MHSTTRNNLMKLTSINYECEPQTTSVFESVETIAGSLMSETGQVLNLVIFMIPTCHGSVTDFTAPVDIPSKFFANSKYKSCPLLAASSDRPSQTLTVAPAVQDTIVQTGTPSPPPPPQEVHEPLAQLERPAASHQHTADDVDQPDDQAQETAALLGHDQQDGLDVVLEEDAGDAGEGLLGDLAALARGGVLVGEHALRVAAQARVGDVVHGAVLAALLQLGLEVEGGGLGHGGRVEGARRGADAALGEDGRHDAEVVLELVEVVRGGVAGAVERVEQRRVVRAEAELVDVVAEIERAVD